MGNRTEMKPDQAKTLGQTLKARREKLGLSTHQLAKIAEIDQATVVRFEAGSILAPHPDKLSRVAEALSMSGADVYALADYLVPTDLPSLKPYLRTRYGLLLDEDISKIEDLVARLAKKRGFILADMDTG